MTIQCITFDLDDTLWAVEPVIVRAENLFYQWLAQNCPRITEQFDQSALTAHRRSFIGQFPNQRHDLTALRKRWIEHIFAQFGYHERSVDDAFRIFWEHRNAVQLFDEVAPVMEKLHRQYRLGVITNGNACVEHIGIGHWFEFVVSSETAGHSKPAPEIFHQALQQARVDAAHIVHVGDDPTNDVLGAAGVGMRTIWYNPRSLQWPQQQVPSATPDASVTSLIDLHQALQSIEAERTHAG